MEYRAIITVFSSSKDYPPINITCLIPEPLALMLMKTPMGKMSIAIERKAGFALDKSKLVDYR